MGSSSMKSASGLSIYDFLVSGKCAVYLIDGLCLVILIHRQGLQVCPLESTPAVRQHPKPIDPPSGVPLPPSYLVSSGTKNPIIGTIALRKVASRMNSSRNPSMYLRTVSIGGFCKYPLPLRRLLLLPQLGSVTGRNCLSRFPLTSGWHGLKPGEMFLYDLPDTLLNVWGYLDFLQRCNLCLDFLTSSVPVTRSSSFTFLGAIAGSDSWISSLAQVPTYTASPRPCSSQFTLSEHRWWNVFV